MLGDWNAYESDLNQAALLFYSCYSYTWIATHMYAYHCYAVAAEAPLKWGADCI